MHVEPARPSDEFFRREPLVDEIRMGATTWTEARTTHLALLWGCVALGLLLRFWQLGEWNFQATEMFTLRDSNRPQFHNPRPLGYVLNYYLIRPFLPFDEFSLRLLPAVFGALAVPVFYFLTRRLIGIRAALVGAFLLAVSPLLIMYSQLARYWSLVFLLCTVYPTALFLGVRDRNRGMLVLGVVTAILAVLAHPVSVLLLGGPILLLLSRLRREHLVQLWNHKGARWTMFFVLALGAAMMARLVPILLGWISSHDKNPGSGQFLLRPPTPPGLKQIVNLMAFVDGLTIPLALIGVLGIYLLWKEGSRWLALFLASLAVFPIAFLAVVSLRTAVSQYYLLPAVPVFFIGAGIFVDRLFDTGFRPRWLLPAMAILFVIAAGAPTLISDHLNGRRFDFRGAAQWLEKRRGPTDVVFSDQPMVLAHYMAGTPVQKLRTPGPLQEAMLELQGEKDAGTLWIVAPAPSHAFRPNLKQGGLIDWMYNNCQLRTTIGVGRVDLRQDYLQVYGCPPIPPQVKAEPNAQPAEL